jgi:hypothetical protein
MNGEVLRRRESRRPRPTFPTPMQRIITSSPDQMGSSARKRDGLRTLLLLHWHRQFHGRGVVRLTCPTLSPMTGRLTHELENAALASRYKFE